VSTYSTLANEEFGCTDAPWKESRMLVLSRKKNESIIINDDITIVVVEIRGDKVRLGVEAPKEVPVHRNEVYEAIRRNQQKPDESSLAPNDGSNAAG
jgi:carbon storage regulator